MATDKATLQQLLERHRSLLVFGAIGVVNTLLHTLAVVTLVESALMKPVAANVAGFVLANCFSFFANCRFAFRQAPSWSRYRRFLGVSLLSLALTVGLSGLAEAMRWHYLVGLLLVLLFGPALSYVLHKTLSFRPKAP